MERVVVDTAAWVRRTSEVERSVEVEAVDVQLTYDCGDPLAVTISIRGDEAVVWVLGRELLAEGLRSGTPVGEGRVQVQSTSVLTEVTWRSEGGAVTLLRLPWWNTREFVRLTQARVPVGAEECDVDAWVAALLATGEA